MPGKRRHRNKRKRSATLQVPTATASGANRYYCRAMTRIPYLRYDDLDARGQEVWGGVARSRGAELVNEQGGLIGPFNAFVHAPGVRRHLSALGGQLAFGTSIDRRATDLP